MKKPYVYVLIDPRKQNEVFYVGKGKGARTTHHIKETRQELSRLTADSQRDVDDALKNLKTDKKAQIAELLKQGYEKEDICRVVAILDTDEEALICESLLIHFVYGLNNLSNIQAGHDSSRFRPHEDWSLVKRLDYPLILRDERRNRKDDLEAELKKHEEFGFISIIDQIANEFKGEWDEWLIRGASDVSRQLRVNGAGNHKYNIKLWGKTTGEGYICIEMRGNTKAIKRLDHDFHIGQFLRKNYTCFFPVEFSSKGKKTKEVKELKRRVRILESIAKASTIQELNSEAKSFIKSLKK